MNIFCSRCARSHPETADYCYYDGMPLRDQPGEGPRHAGSVPFAQPFVFPSGDRCANFNQLAVACQHNWNEARDLLAQRLLPAFFEGLGRADLASAARSAAGDLDADRGLSRLLEQLPAETLQPPRLAAEPGKVSLSNLEPGRDDAFDLLVANRGMLLLSGVATCECDWLTFAGPGGQAQKMFQTTREICLPVRVVGSKLRAASRPLEGAIVIESNGGAVRVPVRADVPIRPFATGVLAGALTPRDIAARAKEYPREVGLLFEQGAVKAWYESNGWTFPLQGPNAAGVSAVQQFYEALGLVKAPVLTLDEEHIQLAGKSGEHLHGRVVLRTRENKSVTAVARSNQAWLVLCPVRARGARAKIPFDVVVPHRPGETLQCQIDIEGNGRQRFVAQVTLTITGVTSVRPPSKDNIAIAPYLVAPPAAPAHSVSAGPPVVAVSSLPGESAPIVSSSGRRLTTLVRDAVDAAVEKAAPARKGTNELSVLALCLGLIGLAITWPFSAPALGILLGVLGLAASGAAAGVVLKHRRTAYGLPALGALINVQGLVMALILASSPPKPPIEPPSVVKPNFPAIGELREALAASDPVQKVKAIEAVGKLAVDLETTREVLLTLLKDSDETVRSAAIDALARLGPAGRIAYPVLVDLAKTDPSKKVRERATLAHTKIKRPTRDDLFDLQVALKDPASADLRSAAAHALGLIGEGAAAAAPALEKALLDADPGVRVSGADALWKITGQAQNVEPVLVSSMDSKNKPEVRARAAAVLGEMKSKNAKAVDALEAALLDVDDGLRIQAIHALGKIGSRGSMKKFITALGDRDVKVRIVAAQALWVIDHDARGVDKLAAALEKKFDADIRWNAVIALGEFGPEARRAVTALSQALDDEDARVRGYAAAALNRIGPEARAAVGALRRALTNADPTRRVQAAFALSGLGAEARAAAQELADALKDRDTEVRLYAARALWGADRKHDVVLRVMIDVLKEEKKQPLQRARAATLLGSLGPRASPAVPELHEALHDPDPRVQLAAAKAVGDIGGPLARITYPALERLARGNDADEAVRSAAVLAVKKVGRPTKADVQTLIRYLQSDLRRFRASAAVCLLLMNRDAKEAVGALSKRLQDDDEVSEAAAYALAAMGADAVAAVPELRNVLRAAKENPRGRAAAILAEIGPPAAEAVDDLNALLLADVKPAIRFEAARALWVIAKQTKGILPVVSAALADGDAELAQRAADTLARIAAGLADPKLKKALSADFKKDLHEKTVPNLRRLLDPDATEPQRAAAALALGALGLDARDAIKDLLALLKGRDAELRAVAAEALGKIGAAETLADRKAVWAKAALPELTMLSQFDANARVVAAVRAAINKIGSLTSDDIDLCLGLLEDKTQPLLLRLAAGQNLLPLGPAIKKADIPRLGALLKDGEDPSLQTLAAYTLAQVGPPAQAQKVALLRALNDQNPGVNAAAAEALGEVFQNQKAAEIRAALERATTSPDENVVAAAQAALNKLKK